MRYKGSGKLRLLAPRNCAYPRSASAPAGRKRNYASSHSALALARRPSAAPTSWRPSLLLPIRLSLEASAMTRSQRTASTAPYPPTNPVTVGKANVDRQTRSSAPATRSSTAATVPLATCAGLEDVERHLTRATRKKNALDAAAASLAFTASDSPTATARRPDYPATMSTGAAASSSGIPPAASTGAMQRPGAADEVISVRSVPRLLAFPSLLGVTRYAWLLASAMAGYCCRPSSSPRTRSLRLGSARARRPRLRRLLTMRTVSRHAWHKLQ